MIPSKKWLFFDVGNVILNDDPGVAFIYKKIHDAMIEKGIDLSFDDLLHERGRMFHDRDKKLVQDLMLMYFTVEEAKDIRKGYSQDGFTRWGELNPLIPKAKAFVEACSQRYHLGVIANQPAVCRDVLIDHDLLKHFKVVALSEAVGKSKPDLDLFRWALKEADADPTESIMLGDRVDNDVRPAKSLGFTTIHLKLNVYDKIDSHQQSDELSVYLPHVDRYNISMREPLSEEETPHYTADSYEELSHHLLADTH